MQKGTCDARMSHTVINNQLHRTSTSAARCRGLKLYCFLFAGSVTSIDHIPEVHAYHHVAAGVCASQYVGIITWDIEAAALSGTPA